MAGFKLRKKPAFEFIITELMLRCHKGSRTAEQSRPFKWAVSIFCSPALTVLLLAAGCC